MICVALWLYSLMAANAAMAQDDLHQPELRIRSPFAASIFRLDVDPSEQFAVVSNARNAATLWKLPQETPSFIHRFQRRNEQNKRAHAVAISPDAALVAYGVPPRIGEAGFAEAGTARVYITQRGSDRVVATIDGVDTRAQALSFSPDGRYLAAILSSGCGLRIWATGDWSEIGSDDKGYGGGAEGSVSCCPSRNADECEALPDTTGLAFAPLSGTTLHLVTSGDTGVRTYDLGRAGLKRKGYVRPTDIDLERPSGVALSPDGGRIAVGDRRCFLDEVRPELDGLRRCSRPGTLPRLRITILTLATLEAEQAPLELPSSLFSNDGQRFLATSAANQANLERVAWMREAEQDYIFAAGFFPCAVLQDPPKRDEPQTGSDVLTGAGPIGVRTANCLVRFKADQDSQSIRFFAVGTDRISDMRALPNRQALLLAGQDVISLVGVDGRLKIDQGQSFQVVRDAADFRDGSMEFRVSSDGRQVVFEDYRSSDLSTMRVRFRADIPFVSAGASSDPELHEPNRDISVVGLQSRWKDRVRSPPVLRGRTLDAAMFGKDETHRAVAVFSQRAMAVFASSEAIRIFKYDGEKPELSCKQLVKAEAQRVNIASNGNLIITGHSDGTLRWYRVIWDSPRTCRLQRLLTVYLKRTASKDWAYFMVASDGAFAFDPELHGELEWQTQDASGNIRVTRFEKLTEWYDKKAGVRALEALSWHAPLAAVDEATRQAAERIAVRADKPSELFILDYPPLSEVKHNPVRMRLAFDKPKDKTWPKKFGAHLADGTPVAIIHEGKRHAPGRAVILQETVDLDIKVELPNIARFQNGLVTVCFTLDAIDHACSDVDWQGPVAELPPRRLWAVLVGLANYESSLLRLPFADNDVVDLARVFLSDYEARKSGAKQKENLDFSEVDLSLALSPWTTKAAEISKLTEKPYVKRIEPTKSAITSAVKAITEQARVQDLSNDLFLFFFSGHGYLQKDVGGRGYTALALPGFDLGKNAEEMRAESILSGELLDLFQQIPSQKLIVIDACRNWKTNSVAQSFSPSEALLEFANRTLTAQFLFSAQEGQVSRTSNQIAFNKDRPEKYQGNSYFTYALLRALTHPEAIGFQPGPDGSILQIRPNLLQVGIDRYFRETGLIGQQNPVEVPARVPRVNNVVRSYFVPPPTKIGSE